MWGNDPFEQDKDGCGCGCGGKKKDEKEPIIEMEPLELKPVLPRED